MQQVQDENIRLLSNVSTIQYHLDSANKLLTQLKIKNAQAIDDAFLRGVRAQERTANQSEYNESNESTHTATQSEYKGINRPDINETVLLSTIVLDTTPSVTTHSGPTIDQKTQQRNLNNGNLEIEKNKKFDNATIVDDLMLYKYQQVVAGEMKKSSVVSGVDRGLRR